jgi:hypothetical protein
VSTTLRMSRNVSADTQVDALFRRLALRYGSLWLDRWIDIPLAAVKVEWAQALDRFDPVQIRQAVLWCGKFPPTLPEFVTFCEQAPRPFVAAVHEHARLESKQARMDRADVQEIISALYKKIDGQ